MFVIFSQVEKVKQAPGAITTAETTTPTTAAKAGMLQFTFRNISKKPRDSHFVGLRIIPTTPPTASITTTTSTIGPSMGCLTSTKSSSFG